MPFNRSRVSGCKDAIGLAFRSDRGLIKGQQVICIRIELSMPISH